MFRQNFSVFNIKETVMKVMKMQEQKAKDKQINLNVEFLGIEDEQ